MLQLGQIIGLEVAGKLLWSQPKMRHIRRWVMMCQNFNFKQLFNYQKKGKVVDLNMSCLLHLRRIIMALDFDIGMMERLQQGQFCLDTVKSSA